MGKAGKNLGLGFVCAALPFLFHPTLNIVDPLPDFIGYILLTVGISRLADMNYHFEEARRYFSRMLGISLLQFVSIFMLFSLFDSRSQPSATLLLCFTFSVAEIIFLPHAYGEMFEGFLYMGSRVENSSAVFYLPPARVARHEKKLAREALRLERANQRRQKRGLAPLTRLRERSPVKNATQAVAAFTKLFVVLKAILTVLPEFSSLTLDRESGSASGFVFWYDYIGLYRTFTLPIVLIFGILWLVKMLGYFSSVTKDRPFMEALIEKYRAEVEPKTHLFITRAIKLAFLVLSVGMFFCPDLAFEHQTINLIPDFLCPLILALGALLLRRRVRIPIYTYLACGVYTVSSLVTWIMSYDFYSKYSLTLTDIRVEAYNAFMLLTGVKLVDCLLFFLMVLSFIPVLLTVIARYTGYVAPGPNINAEDKLRYVHGMLKKRLVVLVVLALLCALGGVAYTLLVKHLNFMWIIEFTFSLILAIYTLTTLNAIVEEVDYKYMLV